MISKEDQLFLAQQKSSEHFKVFKRLIAASKDRMVNGIAMAKNSEQLLIAQGVIRALNALENTLNTGVVQGEALLDQEKDK